VVQALETGRIQSGETFGNREHAQRPQTPSLLDNGSQSISAHNWNQIKVTAKLIPVFSGRDDENVVIWLEHCTNVARMYQVPNETLFLAVIN